MKQKLEKKFWKRFSFFDPEGDIRHTLIPFGFECGNGWFDLLWKLCEDIDKVLKEEKIRDFEIVQVKEKFAGLRFYPRGAIDKIWKLVAKAEKKSFKICEECGRRGRLYGSGCWLKTLCKKCAKKLRAKGYGYYKYKKMQGMIKRFKKEKVKKL